MNVCFYFTPQSLSLGLWLSTIYIKTSFNTHNNILMMKLIIMSTQACSLKRLTTTCVCDHSKQYTSINKSKIKKLTILHPPWHFACDTTGIKICTISDLLFWFSNCKGYESFSYYDMPWIFLYMMKLILCQY